jgi:hypothetical protein
MKLSNWGKTQLATKFPIIRNTSSLCYSDASLRKSPGQDKLHFSLLVNRQKKRPPNQVEAEVAKGEMCWRECDPRVSQLQSCSLQRASALKIA